MSSLAIAAAFGLTSIVRCLLREGLDIDAGSDTGRTALMFTAETGHTDTIKALLEAGADVNKADAAGVTALMVAASEGHDNVVKLLLDNGAKLEIADVYGATFRGYLEAVDFLLNRGADITAQNDTGETVLHTCIHYKPHDDMVFFLVERGIPPNIMDTQGNTALHAAAGRGYGSIIEILIDHGADVNIKNQKGWTPLQEAAASGHEKVVDYLLTQMASPYKPTHTNLLASARLREAINSKDDQIIQDLLKKPDVDIGLLDHDGRTSLHHAAYNGEIDVVQALLERGASVNAKIADSAYQHAKSYYGNAPFDSIYGWQWVTPLHNASGQGHTEFVKLLLSYGADINAVGFKGDKASRIAAIMGHANVIKVFLEYRAQVNEPDGPGGSTPIYWSVVMGHEDVVRLLLENGADEERDTECGTQALTVALENRKTGIAELLKSYSFRTAER
ncbi:MAG: hypothetical protein Q9225_007621 [Loekoesia sp. 1 TL-2023]